MNLFNFYSEWMAKISTNWPELLYNCHPGIVIIIYYHNVIFVLLSNIFFNGDLHFD